MSLTSLNTLPETNFDPRLNYVETSNPFGLVGPPRYFLEELWRFDPLLVIFPSKEEAVYRLARRIEHGQPIFTFLKSRPDTRVFVQHRLTPVTSILPFAKWGPVLLEDLAKRDIRRAGGYKATADTLDDQDDDADRMWRQHVAEESAVRARASWKGQKWTRGETLDLSGRRVQGARTDPRQYHRHAYRPNAGDAPGALIIGRDDHLQEATPFVDVPVVQRRTDHAA